jgi:hypothetical protein
MAGRLPRLPFPSVSEINSTLDLPGSDGIVATRLLPLIPILVPHSPVGLTQQRCVDGYNKSKLLHRRSRARREQQDELK